MFEIHERLVADTFDFGKFDLSFLRLHRSSDVPWFILVPEVDVTELFEIESEQRSVLEAEIDRVAEFLKRQAGVEKINIAAIGNMVPQLHIHVIGRSSRDPFWPGVVWGAEFSGQSYTEAELSDLKHRLGI